MPKSLNVSKLKSDLVKQELAGEIESKLQSHNTNPVTDVEIEWACIRDAVYAAASAVVGPTTRKHQDWFDDNNSPYWKKITDSTVHVSAILLPPPRQKRLTWPRH